MFLAQLKNEWFDNIRGDLLAGAVVALALIPEAIAFSIIAGVDPKVGLYASFCITVIIAFIGGRSGMISAATGAMALVMASLVRDHGIEYLMAATILTGIIQIIAAILKLSSLLKFISNSVFTGFVNALAILIFMAQLQEFNSVGINMYLMVAAGLAIIYLFPYITKSVPSPLVAIIILTIISIVMKLDLRTVGDMGQLPDMLPVFLMPNIPFSWETLQIILPYSITLAAVGLLESLMTAVIIDDMTDTSSAKNRESLGQGVANIVAGFFGGMAGCAMIGQSIINVKSGGRGRLSTLFAGCFLLFLIIVLGDLVKQIPMAALVAVMIMVSISTFSWESIANIRTIPKTSSIVMISTVIVVVMTHDLARGVLVGVIISALFFAKKVSHLLTIESELDEEKSERIYNVYGQVFFVSASQFIAGFNCKEKIAKIIINLDDAHFWDISAVSALDKIILKMRANNIQVELKGLNHASATIINIHSNHNKIELQSISN
jgi:sulfate permease, SulP family